MSFVEQIKEFNEIAGNENEFNPKMVGLYTGLQLEEMSEKIAAFGNENPDLVILRENLELYASEFKSGVYIVDCEHINRLDALDADVDIAVVALGGAIALGADVAGACNEVMESNLSKFPFVDGVRVVIKDSNGKVQKPESYRKPELERFLDLFEEGWAD